MAMERLAVIKETHNKTITALSYNPMKHEILVGFEGTLKEFCYFLQVLKVSRGHLSLKSFSLADYLQQRFYCPRKANNDIINFEFKVPRSQIMISC